MSRLLHIRTLLLASLLTGGLAATAQAQTTPLTLTGYVYDAETDEPLVSVNVFLSGTTQGAATDTTGFFRIEGVRQQTFRLVASMIGYDLVEKTIDRATFQPRDLVFCLPPGLVDLETIEITADRSDVTSKEWQRNLQRFEALLFSTTPFSADCEIINPWVMDFAFDDQTDVLQAAAQRPLVIENRALGYRLTLHALKLIGRYEQLRWEASPFFEPLTGGSNRDQRRWRRNRKEAYEGSTRHFLTALTALEQATEKARIEGKRLRKDPIDEAGFKIYQVSEPGHISYDHWVGQDDLLEMVRPHADNETWTLSFIEPLLIEYHRAREAISYARYMVENGFRARNGRNAWGDIPVQEMQRSWMVLLQPQGVAIDERGLEQDLYAVKYFGYWSWERIAELLPYDYSLEEEKAP